LPGGGLLVGVWLRCCRRPREAFWLYVCRGVREERRWAALSLVVVVGVEGSLGALFGIRSPLPLLVFLRATGGPGSLLLLVVSWVVCLLCPSRGLLSGCPVLSWGVGLFLGFAGAVLAVCSLLLFRSARCSLCVCSPAGVRGSGRLGLLGVSSACGVCWRSAGRLRPVRLPPASPAS
jgi:hypothetical protein